MDPERWHLLETLFSKAREQPLEEQQAFVEHARQHGLLVLHVRPDAVNLEIEEGDLALVVFLETEKAIAADTLAGDTIDTVDFAHRCFTRWLAMMADEVVLAGEVEADDFQISTGLS